MSTTRAIILAAGAGTRLLPLTELKPKCFAEVCGVTILENALRQFAAHGVTRVSIVVGYLQEVFQAAIGASYHGMSIEYVVNPDYRTTNSMYSLYLALGPVSEPVWVLEGDVFFAGSILSLAPTGDFAWFADSSIRDLDGAYLRGDERGELASLEIIRDLGLLRGGHCKSMGLLKLSAAGARQLTQWLAAGVAQNKVNLYYDLIVAEHLHDCPIRIVDVRGNKWFEIDTNEDLARAQEIFGTTGLP